MQVITKKALSRRALIKGAGVSLSLPFLDAMVPALAASPQAKSRLGFFYMPNGVAMTHQRINHWKPKAVGAAFELSDCLKPLERYKSRLVVVSGLAHGQAESLGDGTGEHTRATSTWLSGVHPKYTQGADVRSGVTADQIAAKQFGRETPLPSLEVGIDYNSRVGNCENGYSCAYMNTLAWSDATTPLPTENNPRAIFERLFGDGGDPSQRLAQLRTQASLLDSAQEEMKRLARKLGATDNARVDEYYEAVREVERRISSQERKQQDSGPAKGDELLSAPPAAIPAVFGDHVKMMFDLQWLAFQADITRVVTFMWGRELSPRIYPEIEVTAAHHGMSHHGDREETLATYAKVNAYYSELLGHFLDRLNSTPDVNGTLLDNTLLLHGAGLSDGNLHSHFDLPLMVVGGAAGRVKGGLHIACKDYTPMTNLLLTMLEKSGVNVDRLGDSAGQINLSSPVGV